MAVDAICNDGLLLKKKKQSGQLLQRARLSEKAESPERTSYDSLFEERRRGGCRSAGSRIEMHFARSNALRRAIPAVRVEASSTINTSRINAAAGADGIVSLLYDVGDAPSARHAQTRARHSETRPVSRKTPVSRFNVILISALFIKRDDLCRECFMHLRLPASVN